MYRKRHWGSSQIYLLRQSPFLQATPRVDLSWESASGDPSNGSSLTRLTVSFLEGSEGMGLESLAIDLPDYSGTQGGISQTPAYFSTVLGNIVSPNGEGSVTVQYRENMRSVIDSGDSEPFYGDPGAGPELKIEFLDMLLQASRSASSSASASTCETSTSIWNPVDLVQQPSIWRTTSACRRRALSPRMPHASTPASIAALAPSVENPQPFGLQLLPGELPRTGELVDGIRGAHPRAGARHLGLDAGRPGYRGFVGTQETWRRMIA